MDPQYFYQHEKLQNAVSSLATSPLPLRERVLNAYSSFLTLDDDDFEEPQRSKFNQLMEMLTKVKNPDRGHVPATLEVASENELQEIARLIFELFVEVERLHHDRL